MKTPWGPETGDSQSGLIVLLCSAIIRKKSRLILIFGALHARSSMDTCTVLGSARRVRLKAKRIW